MEKLLSIRIRKNGFKFNKKNGKNYKSVFQQIEHDYRIEKMEKGYLKSNNKNIYNSNNELRNNGSLDFNNLEKNIGNMFEKIKEDYKEHNNNKSWNKTTKPFLTGVVSFSSGFMLDMDNSKDLSKVLNDFILKEFSQKLTCVIHRDEKSLHFHFTIFNYDFRTHKTIGRNIDTSKLQDKLQDYLISNKQDYGHKRGISKKLTKSKHLELMDMKNLELENQKKEINILKNKQEQLQNENNLLSFKNKNLKKLSQDLYKDFTQIINDLIELNKESEVEGFVKKLNRYVKSENKEKLNKLISKYSNSIKKMKEDYNKKVSNSNINYINKQKDNEELQNNTNTNIKVK